MSKILASVAGNAIYDYEVEEMIAAYAQRGQNFDNPQGREAVLEQLINKKLLLADAQKNLMEHNAEFKKELAKVKEEMLANFCLQKAIESVKVTEDEVKAYFEENKAQFKKPESVAASHILVDTEEKANEILAKINAGEVSFEDAARNESSCPSSQNGGALGEFTRGQMVPEFDEAVFSMAVGEVSSPVKTQFGFHIIKLTAKNEAAEMEFDAIKAQLEGMVLNEKRKKAYESKINQLKILYPVDKM